MTTILLLFLALASIDYFVRREKSFASRIIKGIDSTVSPKNEFDRKEM